MATLILFTLEKIYYVKMGSNIVGLPFLQFAKCYSTVSHVIYDTEGMCNFVINEYNPTFEVQNMGNDTFLFAPCSQT